MSQIETSVQAIDRLISDLTDFASTGLGTAMPIAPAPVNLEALCKEFSEIQAAHPQCRLACDAHGDLTIVADAARMRQVVSNLLGNACQHDSSQGPITLSLSGKGSASVALSIHNGGAPIPSDRIATIFDPLVRGNDSLTQRRHGSIGLGLYIVREIVTAHGGSVELTSCESDGTRFTVHIPRRPPEKEHPPE